MQPKRGKDTFSILDPTLQFDEKRIDKAGIAQSLNAAFLITLADRKHPELPRAKRFLARMKDSSEWAHIATFYINGIGVIHREIENMCTNDRDFSDRLKTLSTWMSNNKNLNNAEEAIEKIWSVFFPEANDILTNKSETCKKP